MIISRLVVSQYALVSRDDILVNQHLAVSALHSIHETLQDLAAVIICPVVEDRVHIVSASTYRRKKD
jgi:hypothetical protein